MSNWHFPYICAVCGEEFEPVRSTSKYCSPSCAKEGQRRNQRAWYECNSEYRLEYQRRRKKKEPSIKKREYTGKKKAGVNIEGLTINEICRLAREKHMSYGEYVAIYGS